MSIRTSASPVVTPTELIEVLARASPILVAGDDDQALYGFRHASAIYLRDLAKDDRYTNFELPFCSRCTEVLVGATHRVVKEAQTLGLLAERIDKSYVSYRPDKQSESDRHPKIVHARCSVESRKTPYMERYLEAAINGIPDEDVAQSRDGGHPTVLVIGPRQFSNRAYEHLAGIFPGTEIKMSDQLELRAIDAYRRLMKDQSSRLGWRILLSVRQPNGWRAMVASALADSVELYDLLDTQFRGEHLDVVRILRRIESEEADLATEELTTAVQATGLSLGELLLEFGIDSTAPDDHTIDEADPPKTEEEGPSILVTSLMGAKGLQAEHVFVVGVNGGHFPRNNKTPTEDEVCQLLVALTRARKSCTIASTRRFGAALLADSVFTKWLGPFLDTTRVNKEYFK